MGEIFRFVDFSKKIWISVVICLLAVVVSKKGQVDKSIAMLNKEIYCSLRYIFEFGCFKAAHLLEHQGLQGFCSKV